VPRVPNSRDGDRRLIRHDWNLYSRVRTALAQSNIAFGDYTTKHPQSGIGRGVPQPYLIYTAEDFWWHFRRLRGKMRSVEAYQVICQTCVAKPEWMGPHFSDGDHRIADYAGPMAPAKPGMPSEWLKAMFGHHMTLVSEQVRRAR
jgi:hypothetical protein